VAPTGAVTLRLVLLPDDTVAFVAPNQTALRPGVPLKLVPLMVTELPVYPLSGLTEVMAGAGVRVAVIVGMATPVQPSEEPVTVYVVVVEPVKVTVAPVVALNPADGDHV
jgi:hypothetical protein